MHSSSVSPADANSERQRNLIEALAQYVAYCLKLKDVSTLNEQLHVVKDAKKLNAAKNAADSLGKVMYEESRYMPSQEHVNRLSDLLDQLQNTCYVERWCGAVLRKVGSSGASDDALCDISDLTSGWCFYSRIEKKGMPMIGGFVRRRTLPALDLPPPCCSLHPVPPRL